MVAATVFGKIISIFIIMLVGVLCYRLGFIDDHTKQKLSGIVNYIVVPAIIFTSLQMDYDQNLLKKMAIVFLIALLSYSLSILVARLALREKDGYDLAIEKMAITYNNCGFIGIPLCSALFGNIGAIYATIFVACFHLFMWTHGIMLMANSGFQLKKLLNPCLIALAVGLACFLLQIRLPESVAFSANSIAALNTPLAMMLSGAIMAQLDLKASVKKLRLYQVAVLRVVIVPLIMCAILRFLPIDEEMRISSAILAACPTGAMCITMAVLYGRDDHYATELFTVTTLLSLITMPICAFMVG